MSIKRLGLFIHGFMTEIKRIMLALILLLFIFLPWFSIQARSGCCSHHGGVCGCSCCDGTSLSAKCAPYYPQCSAVKSAQAQFEIPQSTSPQSTALQSSASKNITPITENQQADEDSENFITENPEEEKNNGFTWLLILGIGFGSYILYKFAKRDRKINQE